MKEYLYSFSTADRKRGILAYRDPKDMTVTELIERFEGDILYDAHRYATKFGRSDARKELQKRGQPTLRAICDHLKENPPNKKSRLVEHLETAWGELLAGIEKEIDPEMSAPQILRDTVGWIAWAERFADPS